MILITGGAGFIGSHTCIELISAGYEVLIIDNFCNSSPERIDCIHSITGQKVSSVAMDVRDVEKLEDIFLRYNIEAVVHCAGYKAVGGSVQKPLAYYRNNIDCTLALCEVMEKNGVKKLIFSSSATVYRNDNVMPVAEDAPLACINPYGWTKLMIEQVLRDVYASDNEWAISLLRYFNPIGAHPSGLIGDDPEGIPNNLMPYITQVVAGKLDTLHVYGNDYPTYDGTGIRDYIHVVDLARGHISALNYALKNNGVEAFNLGTGYGYSVLDVIHTFERVNGTKVPMVIEGRRSGDVAISYAKVQKAADCLGWKAEYGLEKMCEDSWNFACRQYASNFK